MLVSDFLTTRERNHARTQRRAKLDRFMSQLGLITIFFMVGLVIGNIIPEHRLFDYDKCDYLVAKGNLGTAPIPADYEWKEISETPGGNWCVTSLTN